ncbi:hypothetical protein F5X71_26270 [Nocardia brasiliensis]|uniref:Prokaryotic phospholipase A2 n=1 Tax=Nocardia brasiliensis TaxID=37326 RepID=A0A6G9XWP9_NOCBR|nr:hypothetical protein [Nocardia brasiliensis]QIS05349.1 hypothetical protein F5X71_26270 [Nocardia brasiliensis]
MSTPTPAGPTATRPAPAASTTTRRAAACAAAALTTMAATVFLAPAPQAAAASELRAPAESALARVAVAELTSGGPGSLTAIPADFPARFGYRPGTLDGLVVNPQGDCSSPVTLPAEFDTACKAHDLGYDLLRYAEERGEPLGPWARQALDATLDRHMHQACGTRADAFSRARCDTMATIAATFVDLNSRRQDYGAPVAESLLDAAPAATTWQLLGVLGAGLAGLAAALTVRNRNRNNPAAAPGVPQ